MFPAYRLLLVIPSLSCCIALLFYFTVFFIIIVIIVIIIIIIVSSFCLSTSTQKVTFLAIPTSVFTTCANIVRDSLFILPTLSLSLSLSLSHSKLSAIDSLSPKTTVCLETLLFECNTFCFSFTKDVHPVNLLCKSRNTNYQTLIISLDKQQ